MKPEFALVGLACGKQYLKVGPVTVAVEGDLCRDCMIPDKFWTPENLQEAADRINAAIASMMEDIYIESRDY